MYRWVPFSVFQTSWSILKVLLGVLGKSLVEDVGSLGMDCWVLEVLCSMGKSCSWHGVGSCAVGEMEEGNSQAVARWRNSVFSISWRVAVEALGVIAVGADISEMVGIDWR